LLSKVRLAIVAAMLAAWVAQAPVATAQARSGAAPVNPANPVNPAESILVPQATDPASSPAPKAAGPGLPTLDNSNGNIAQRVITGSQATRCRPGVSADGTIVVCRDADAREKERLPLRDQTDTAQSTNDGVPRAPNVSGLPPCKGNGACLGFGSVPPPMYYFDITALPPPPPGSDADRIAKGEIRAP